MQQSFQIFFYEIIVLSNGRITVEAVGLHDASADAKATAKGEKDTENDTSEENVDDRVDRQTETATDHQQTNPSTNSDDPAPTPPGLATVTFANPRALRRFLFSKDQDVLDSLLANEVDVEGNLTTSTNSASWHAI